MGMYLVWDAASLRVGRQVLHRRQVHAHGRVHGHVLQQGAEVAEGVGRQHVVPGGDGRRLVVVQVLQRDHEDLGQGKGHALAQLVVSPQGALIEGRDDRAGADGVAGHDLLPGGVVGVVAGQVHGLGGLGELLVHPAGGAQAHGAGQIGVSGAEAGLGEQAEGVGPGGAGRGRHGLGLGFRGGGGDVATALAAATGGQQPGQGGHQQGAGGGKLLDGWLDRRCSHGYPRRCAVPPWDGGEPELRYRRPRGGVEHQGW